MEKGIYYTNGDKAAVPIALIAYDVQAKRCTKNSNERKQNRDSPGVASHTASHGYLASVTLTGKARI